jgi:D-alanine-D-alanine ligase
MSGRRKLQVAVLMGGDSSEREVSLMSGRMVIGSLDPRKYEVFAGDAAALAQSGRLDLRQLPPPRELLAERDEKRPRALAKGLGALPDGRPDVVFIALHGRGGEDGALQGMLELLGLPYTGSGVLASALAMNKVMTKKIFEREGLPTPRWLAFRGTGADSAAFARRVQRSLPLPVVVKPACEGSTIGTTVVRRRLGLRPALKKALKYGPEVLAEEFIFGTEITAGILGNERIEVLPLVEIVPASGLYDYHSKYTPGATEEIVPARVSKKVARRAEELALASYRALGCRGFGRVDMIAAEKEVYLLELNTIPGLTATSLVPRAAAAAGISFPQLLDRIIALALERPVPDVPAKRRRSALPARAGKKTAR